MAEITFGIYNQNNIVGSGLGFYGATFGSSVQIGSYQDSTFVTDGTGTDPGPASLNLKFSTPATGVPSRTVASGIPITKVNQGQRSFHINFDHSTEINVQNCQLRIYDRVNTNYPSSGVLTKVCEMVNFDGKTYTDWAVDQGGNEGSDNTLSSIGSGDLFWWGAPWPDQYVSQNYYTNSSGVKFLNFNQTEATAAQGNGDDRLGSVTGDTETVGGTGVIVPLFNSPGSGARFMNTQYQADTGTPLMPKWVQYYNSSSRPDDIPNLGSATTTNTFGGSGVDTRHTWHVGISASPLSIGSKTQYGLYVSLEYL
jgi:hypothetical protein